MNALIAAAKEFGRDEAGVTAIEYGLIAAVMAGAVALAITPVADALALKFTAIVTALAP